MAIHWNSSECTTSDVEDFVLTIEPFIHLKEVNIRKIRFKYFLFFVSLVIL